MRSLVTLLTCLFIIDCPVSGQEAEPPYSTWLEMLSAKKDVRGEKYRTVEIELSEKYRAEETGIQNLDSVRFCDIFSTLKSKAPSGKERLEIRLMNLEARFKTLRWIPQNCTGLLQSEELYLSALNKAYELEDDVIIFQLYKNLQAYYTDKNLFGKAALYGMLAKELYEQKGKDRITAMSGILHDLGLSLFRNREYRSAIDVNLLFLLHDNDYLNDEDRIDPLFHMFGWNTVGLAYTRLNNPDSAFIAFDHATQIADSLNNTFWISLIKGNRGDVFYRMGKMDSAEVYLITDYEGSIAAKEYDNAANSLQWLARIDLLRNKPEEALRKSREAYRLLQISPRSAYKTNTLKTFTKVFAALGKADSMNLYMDRFLVLHDSLEHQASESRTANVMLRLESQENINTILSLNREKRKVELMRNFIIVFIILSSLIIFIILNQQKLKLTVRRQEALEEKRIAELETRSANQQLILFTRNLIEKNSLVETLQQQLLQRDISEEQKNHIAALSAHVILTDDDWENFKSLFEKVYPGFFYNMRQKVSDLSMSDLRIAAMSKLQLSNKEAASLLGIAPNSVLKARQRLRHRLGLGADTDLEHYLAHSHDFK